MRYSVQISELLVSFIKQHGISYTYWCWNPNFGDTGGMLNNDWQTVSEANLASCIPASSRCHRR
jgi:hypothetical protein